MGHFRRIFTAPGNLRIWFSLIIYVSALVALLVYRERIGRTVSRAFQEATKPTKAPSESAPPADEGAAVRQALALPPGAREARLLTLARGGSRAAVKALARLVRRRPAGTVISDALRTEAAAALEDDERSVRAVAAGLLLWAEKVPLSRRAAAGAAIAAGSRHEVQRLGALRRLGLLGLLGIRGRGADRIARGLRARTEKEQAIAARAAGRSGDGSLTGPLLRLVAAEHPRPVRLAALAGLTDLALADRDVRSEVLRRLATRLAEPGLSTPVAEEIWRTLRRLARRPSPPKAPGKKK